MSDFAEILDVWTKKQINKNWHIRLEKYSTIVNFTNI